MYQFKSRVRFSEVDSQLHMTLPSIINYFQDCSTFHSDSIGYGIEVMMEQGYAWILSSWQIIINRYPKFGEEITVSTWAHGWKAFSAIVILNWKTQKVIFWPMQIQTGSI